MFLLVLLLLFVVLFSLCCCYLFVCLWKGFLLSAISVFDFRLIVYFVLSIS